MTWGQIFALIVLLAVLLSFVVSLPEWVQMALIGLLAVAILAGGYVAFRHRV